jgi:hypothetical protein
MVDNRVIALTVIKAREFFMVVRFAVFADKTVRRFLFLVEKIEPDIEIIQIRYQIFVIIRNAGTYRLQR